MIDDPRGRIDYDEYGAGPALVLVAGSCSTGAAWRPVMAGLNGQFRCVTTSLLGYGETAERRTAHDTSIVHEAEIVEAVMRKAGDAVHLVGHSFGGIVALTVVLRRKVTVSSLTVLEAPAAEMLREYDEAEHYAAFRAMTDRYFAAFAAGETDAIAVMIDFYGGAGTYASWPERVRAYAAQTTAVNIRDWASAYEFPLWRTALAAVTVPTLVAWGETSHPAAQRANALLAQSIRGARSAVIEGAAHFMTATHAGAVARLIADHAKQAETTLASTS
jgi:pimeloyl-ACP methyl ester carboxylesterase